MLPDMLTTRLLAIALGLAVLTTGCGSTADTASTDSAEGTSSPLESSDPDWPRVIEQDGVQIVLQQPQVDEWPQYRSISGRVAASVLLPGESEPYFGALEFTAETDVDFDTRTVFLIHQQVTKATFHADAATSEKLAEAVKAIETKPTTLTLDFVLAHMVEQQVTGRSIEAMYDPPTIFTSQKPAILVLFDGDPIFVRVDSTLDLEFAFNTNWDLFRIPSSGVHYLMDNGHWLTANTYKGPWQPTDSLSDQIGMLPDNENWSEVRSRLDVAPYRTDSEPHVFISTVPAELILIDGWPKFEPIGGTSLNYVSNTSSDLFYEADSEEYYYLVSGRWFAADDLNGPWFSALYDLPADFARIPYDHPKAYVRASVPGTPEAEEAIRLAQVPQQAEISRSEASLEVDYDGDPTFEPVEETSIERAANTTQDVFLVDGRYYACQDAVWFESDGPDGPWTVADEVPEAIYTIPPSSASHHVTYVYVYDSTPDIVVTGYTGGYTNMYVSYGVVVYGTGWYYPPYYHYPPHYAYPVYHPYPHSYGVAAGYNPHTGTYWRGGAAYGPYGGYGGAAAYNPRTGTYARGAAAYGPYGAARGYQAYNPRTGTSSRGYQVSTPYESWGRSATHRGDQWVQSGYYSNRQGTVAGARGSEGGAIVTGSGQHGSGTVVRDREGNVYAGKDGNVYKKGDEGWHKREGDTWGGAETAPARTGSTRDSTPSELSGVQQDYNKRTQGNQRSNYSRSQRQRQRSGRGR